MGKCAICRGTQRIRQSDRERDLRLLADADARARPLRDRLGARPAATRATLVVGPEGGFTDAERDAAVAAGFDPVRLEGPVMRIETAAPALLAIVRFACA